MKYVTLIVATTFGSTLGAFLSSTLTSKAHHHSLYVSKNDQWYRRRRQNLIPQWQISNIYLRDADDNEEDGEDEISFNMEELQERMDRQLNQYHDFFLTSEENDDDDDNDSNKPEDVYIILFSKDTEDEGVHTIEYPKGSGNNIILAFESSDECNQFSEMLRQSQFFTPQPQKSNLMGLEAYCNEIGVPIKVVPAGMDLRPPSENVDELTKNPILGEQKKQLEKLFDIPPPSTNEKKKKGEDSSSLSSSSDDDFGSWE